MSRNSIDLGVLLPQMLSKECAKELSKEIKKVGITLPFNRLLIAVLEDEIKVSGIYIPGETESMPKVGTIIAVSNVTSDGYHDYDLSEDMVGSISTFGIYAGKEVSIDIYPGIRSIFDKYKISTSSFAFKVISTSELAMVQPFPLNN